MRPRNSVMAVLALGALAAGGARIAGGSTEPGGAHRVVPGDGQDRRAQTLCRLKLLRAAGGREPSRLTTWAMSGMLVI